MNLEDKIHQSISKIQHVAKVFDGFDMVDSQASYLTRPLCNSSIVYQASLIASCEIDHYKYHLECGITIQLSLVCDSTLRACPPSPIE